MALPQPFVSKDRYSEDDYFVFEETSFGQWEFVNGEIRAMAGGSDDHNTIAGNLAGALRNAIASKGCRVYGPDMRVHTGNGINTFPDVSVVCGPRKYHRGRADTITNPILIAEVLSPSTQGYDRGEKFDHYKTVSTLTDYLIVFPETARIMLYTRDGDHWELRDIVGLDSSVNLTSVHTTLALSDVYDQIEFEDSTAISPT